MRLPSIKPVYKNSFAALVSIVCLIILFFFPLRTLNPVWKGYRVLVVPLEQNEQKILDTLEKQGINDIVTESNSLILNINSKTPSLPSLGKWNEDRLGWFRNVSTSCRYFYLAETPFLETKANKAFSGVNFNWYLEHSEGIQLFPVLFGFLFLIICLFLLKQRILFAIYNIPIGFYAYFCNTVSGYITSIFSILLFFLLAGLLEPENKTLSLYQRLTRIKHHWIPLLLFPIIIGITSTGGWQPFLIYVVSLTLSVSITILFFSLKVIITSVIEKKRIHPVFHPVTMNPETIIGKWPKKTDVYVFIIALLLSATGYILFNAQNSKTSISDKQELYIPSPSGYTVSTGFTMDNWNELSNKRTENSLPDLGTYVAVRWNLDTAPWRRIQDSTHDPVAGETISNNQFFADKNGIITGKKNTMFTFDTNFIRKILSSGITPLETMLIRQGRFMTVEIARQAR